MNTPLIVDDKIKEKIKLAIQLAGSQNNLARMLGYNGKNCGCQINYLLCGRIKTIPQKRYDLLLDIFNEK
jgi:hypothetical protein